MIAFDVQALTAYYLDGSSFSVQTRRAMAAAKIATDRGPAVITPWQLKVAPLSDADKLLKILGSARAFNLNDPILDRPGMDDNFRKLFTLYNGLGLMADLADLAAETRVQGTSRAVLQRKLDGMFLQLDEFLADNLIDGVSIIKGLKLDQISTKAFIPPLLPDRRIEGAVISDTRDQAIVGVDTQTFYIDVTNANGLNTVTIDLSQVPGVKSVENIVAYMNDQMAAANLLTEFEINRFNEFEYGFLIVQTGGETISFRPDAADVEAAAYVVGDNGFDQYADVFVRKFDGLGTADPDEVFFEEFGAEEARDVAQGVAVDSQGNVYVVGTTEGDLDGQNNPAGQDIFLTKYDSAGNEMFTRMLGTTTGTARAFDIEIDSQDNVIIAGTVVGALSIDSFGGGVDGFVAKFSSTGQELFVYQQSPPGPDATVAIAIDADDNIIVGGYVEKVVSAGFDSNFITLDPAGNRIADRAFGSFDSARIIDMTMAPDGNVLILSDVDGEVRVTKFAGIAVVYSERIGTVGTGGVITGFAADATGIYVTGSAGSDAALDGTIIGGGHSGDLDAFVLKASVTDGKAISHTYLGSADTDRGTGIAVNNGEVFITGSTTGLLGAQTFGSLDGFVAKFDSNLNTQFVEQFRGSFGFGAGTAIAIDPNGSSVLSWLGLPTGDLPATDSLSVTSNTTVRPDQQFSISINGGRPKRITIGADDSFRMLTVKLNALLGSKGKASLVKSGDDGGRALKILAKNGATIEILHGPDGRSALFGLGLEPMILFGEAAVGQGKAPSDSAFALGLIGALSLLDKSDASDTAALLRGAQKAMKDAFWFLTGTEKDDPLKKKGGPSAYMLSRISNMREGLLRLSGGLVHPSTFA